MTPAFPQTFARTVIKDGFFYVTDPASGIWLGVSTLRSYAGCLPVTLGLYRPDLGAWQTCDMPMLGRN